VARLYCGALGGASPTGNGSCAALPPATLVSNTGTPGTSGWFTTPVTVTLTPVDAGGNGIDHTEYGFDGANWTTYATPFALPEGQVTLYYRTFDKTGHREPTQIKTFEVDTKPPTTTASTTIQGGQLAFSFGVNDPTPGSGGAGIHTISKVGNTGQLVTQFTSGATGTVQLNTLCTDIEYWGEDAAGNQTSPHYHMLDSVPPKLTVPANVTTLTCSTTASAVQVGQATATDECVATVVPTGQVIATNGQTLAKPIPVVDGKATLGPGTHTVQWIATDGTNKTTVTQTVVVGIGIQASQSLLVEDRATVQNSAGGFAAVANSGTGVTQVGNDAHTGSIVSVGAVRVLHRAVVTGDVTSASTIFKETDGTITGTSKASTTVVLPGLAALPTFPSPSAGSFTVNSGTQSKQPGSYTSGTVSGGTLVLTSGNYYFQSLTINANVTIRATATTRIYVRDSLVVRSSFKAETGTALQSIYLGFAGSTLAIEAPFRGTLLAPNATVTLGVDTSLTFTGSFFAKVLDLRPASTIICQ
jgi:hypothetical protein